MARQYINGLIAFVLMAGVAAAQNSNTKTADSLLFSVKHFCYDSAKGAVCRMEAKPSLQYDFTWQYPYYTTGSTAWVLGEQLQLEFTRLPASGFVYIFSIDGNNTPVLLSQLRIGADNMAPLIFPGPLKGLALETEGVQYIGIWYSRDSLGNAGKLIRGMEFTTGPVVKRNNRQLGKQLLAPNYGWHFESNLFGFVTDTALQELPEKFVLPVVIEMSVSKQVRNRKQKLKNK